MQGYTATIALTGLLVAVLAAAQRNAMRAARDWRTRFEAAIGAHRLLAYEWDPASGAFVVTGDTAALVGVPPARSPRSPTGSRTSRRRARCASRRALRRCAPTAARRAPLAYRVTRPDGDAARSPTRRRRSATTTASCIASSASSASAPATPHDATVRTSCLEARRRRPRQLRRTASSSSTGSAGRSTTWGRCTSGCKNAGFVTHSLTLPGHGTKPEDLAGVTAEDWIDAVVAKYREVRDQHPTLHLMGMCMGSLLAAVLAERERHAKGNLVLLAPPIFIDGWATPWYRGLRPLLYAYPDCAQRMKIEEEDPFGIKNEQLRAIVKAKFERGENFHYRWVPLECIRQVDRLRAIVMKAAKRIRCPTLVVHAREDELTSLRSANFLVEPIGGARARMVVLEDSYHMICVDNDREIVAKNVLEFFGAALPGATSALANDPRMSGAGAARRGRRPPREPRRRRLLRCARSGFPISRGCIRATTRSPARTSARRSHRSPGACRRMARRDSRRSARRCSIAASRSSRRRSSRARGRRARVAGRAAVRVPRRQAARGALVRRRGRARGRVLRTARSGRQRSLRARAAFEAATAASRTLQKAPDNDTLLALYSLFKQASAGDVVGERPGALDMVGRAKYDAWAKRKGMGRDDAMRQYVALVEELKRGETGPA